MTKTAKKQNTKTLITIDYPKTGEVIWSGHYAVRISGGLCEEVEISIDGGNWALCRHEAGHCWFDLHGIKDGVHELTARIIGNGGNSAVTRKFKVSGNR